MELPVHLVTQMCSPWLQLSLYRVDDSQCLVVLKDYQQPKVDIMAEAQRLRERSARCTRLVKEMTDPAMIASLKATALESDEAAEALEKSTRHQPQPGGMP